MKYLLVIITMFILFVASACRDSIDIDTENIILEDESTPLGAAQIEERGYYPSPDARTYLEYLIEEGIIVVEDNQQMK